MPSWRLRSREREVIHTILIIHIIQFSLECEKQLLVNNNFISFISYYSYHIIHSPIRAHLSFRCFFEAYSQFYHFLNEYIFSRPISCLPVSLTRAPNYFLVLLVFFMADLLFFIQRTFGDQVPGQAKYRFFHIHLAGFSH